MHNRPHKVKKEKKKDKKPKQEAKEEPKYIQERIDIFDRLWAEQEAEIAGGCSGSVCHYSWAMYLAPTLCRNLSLPPKFSLPC